MCGNNEVMREAFRDVTLCLAGVFDAFDANPEMVHAVADALARVFRSQMRGTEPPRVDGATSPMEGLLEEIGRASMPSECCCSHRK